MGKAVCCSGQPGLAAGKPAHTRGLQGPLQDPGHFMVLLNVTNKWKAKMNTDKTNDEEKEHVERLLY